VWSVQQVGHLGADQLHAHEQGKPGRGEVTALIGTCPLFGLGPLPPPAAETREDQYAPQR
jgi:hypothetical protein